MVDIDITYDGELHCSASHRPSSATLATDAPLDNHGRGQSFSPTDLVATALGTCMATVMGILGRSKGYVIDGLEIHVRKGMTSTPPRRIARLEVKVQAPAAVGSRLDEPARALLEEAALHCPVRLSLLDAIEVPVHFEWQGAELTAS